MKIDKGIPIPAPSKRNLPGITQTMRDLAVGDSFVIPKEAAANGGLYAVAGYVGIKITRKTNPDGSCRIWRTA